VIPDVPQHPRLFDRTGKPIDSFLKWAELISQDTEQRVARTTIGPYQVSTVWMGIDHNYFCPGPPLIFETAIFTADRSMPYCQRHATLESAQEGHNGAVRVAEQIMRIDALSSPSEASTTAPEAVQENPCKT
jgi:hypothetical protein